MEEKKNEIMFFEKNPDINELEKTKEELLNIINEMYTLLREDNSIRKKEKYGIEYDFDNMINELKSDMRKGVVNRFKCTCQLLKTSSYVFIEKHMDKFNILEKLVEKLDTFF